jgi:NADH-quinone oxidoreductase subunit G
LGKAFVVYQGHHGDAGAHRADVVLPGAAYSEKNATYVNTEGRVQRARLAIFPPGDAREDWTILRALSAVLGKTLPYDDAVALRAALVETNAIFARTDTVATAPWEEFGFAGKLASAPFQSSVNDFYLTDPICRASETMAKCRASETMAKCAELAAGNSAKTGTDG